MAKADVLQLVQDISLAQADSSVVDRYYEEVIQDLGRLPASYITDVELVPVTAGTAEYSAPSNTVDIMGIFFDDRILYQAPNREIEVVDPHWRDADGSPIVFNIDDLDTKSFRLYPNPDTASKDFSFLLGLPMGLDYPEYCMAIARTKEVTDVPTWLEWPLAFEILAREFMRESDHQDEKFATLCRRMALVMLSMVAQ